MNLYGVIGVIKNDNKRWINFPKCSLKLYLAGAFLEHMVNFIKGAGLLQMTA